MTAVPAALSLITVASYAAAVCVKGGGVPYSISATFYAIRHGWWFRLTMWLTPALLMPAVLEAGKADTGFLAFLALAGMIMVGCFPDYKAERFYERCHVAGAVMAIALSQLWVALNAWRSLSVWLLYAVCTAVMAAKGEGTPRERYRGTRPLFWAEACALASVYLALASGHV